MHELKLKLLLLCSLCVLLLFRLFLLLFLLLFLHSLPFLLALRLLLRLLPLRLRRSSFLISTVAFALSFRLFLLALTGLLVSL